MDWWSRLTSWIKLSPKYLISIGLVAGFLLFAPHTILRQLGLDMTVNQWRSVVAIVFLATVSLLSVESVVSGGRWIAKRHDLSRKQKNRLERLRNLTPEEKEILIGYILSNSKTQSLSMSDGVVNGLELAQIIYKASTVGDLDSWPYNIQPWVWAELKKHRREIVSDEEIDNFIKSGISPEKHSRLRSGYPF